MYDSEMCVEGLLGITLDRKDIVLVNIREVIRQASRNPSNDSWREDMPVRDMVEAVEVADTLAGNETLKQCGGNRGTVPCKEPGSRPESNHDVSAMSRESRLGESDGMESVVPVPGKQGGSGTDWVSDIIHNTIGPEKGGDFDANNEATIHPGAGPYEDSNHTMNFAAMSVGMNAIHASGSCETIPCGPVSHVGDHRCEVNGDAAASRILLPDPIMQTEKQVSDCDSNSQKSGFDSHRNGVRNLTDLTCESHGLDGMTYVDQSCVTGHSNKVKVKMEPFDDASLSHLVGLADMDAKLECSYTCHLCRRAFSHKRTLMRHQRTHHLGQKHFCPFCNKPFGRKDTMRRHSLMYHPMAPCTPMSVHQHIPIHSSIQ